MMRRAFALGTFRQALAATTVIFLATTALAQENQQPSEEKSSANTQQTEQSEADQKEADQKEADNEEKEKETVVLKVIEFKAMTVNDFLSAAQVAGVVDRRTAYSAPRQRVGAQQGTSDQKRLYLGVKPNSSLLFVRGLEKEVNKVEELAKKLDMEPDKMPETLRFENGKQARRIPQAELTDVKELLGSLGLKTSTAVVGGAHFLVIEESDETNVKQIEQVLEMLSETRDKEDAAEGDGEQESQDKEEPAEGDAEETKDQPEEQTDQESEEQEADAEKDQ